MQTQFTTNRQQTAKAANLTIAKKKHSFYNQSMRKISNKFSAGFLILIFASFFVACGGSGNSNANQTAANNQVNSGDANSNAPSEDLMELINKVRLPELPEENVWREEISGDQTTGGKARRKITVVLKYTPEGSARLVSLIAARQPVAEAEIGTEDWFPEELIAQSQISGNESLKVDSYAANDFFNEPYSQGKLSRVRGTGYFILELSAP